MSFDPFPNDPGLNPLPYYRVGTRTGFDMTGRDVNVQAWARLLAVIAATNGGRGAHIVFDAGDLCLNNAILDTNTITRNGAIVIEGQGDSTRIFPGGNQGRALTIVGTNGVQIKPTLKNFRLGYGVEIANPDLPYSQPILELRTAKGANLDRITGFLHGTGTILYLNDTYNSTLAVALDSGQYAVPIQIDRAANPADQMDTIRIGGTILGEYGLLINGSLNNLESDQLKCTKSSASTLAESSVANNAAAGDPGVTLAAGEGASFAINDSVQIDVGGTTVGPAEVNKITGINGDVLTFAWPLQYAHNGLAAHIQVVRGGISVTLPGNYNLVDLHDSHFEGHDTAVLVNFGKGLKLSGNSVQTNRYVRCIGIGGAIDDIEIGRTLASGAPPGAATSNIMVDVPLWAVNLPTGLVIDGPLNESIQATVNWLGTSFNIDSRGYVTSGLGLGASFAAGPWLTPGVKLGKEGLRFRGLLTMAAIVAAGATVLTLPPWMVPFRSALLLSYQVNTQSTSATPAPNALWVQGSDQGASKGLVTLRVATTAAGWLDLDSVPPLSVHQA